MFFEDEEIKAEVENTEDEEEVSEERLLENLDAVRAQIAYYREYPDVFIDDIKGPDCGFKFRFSQRIFFNLPYSYLLKLFYDVYQHSNAF